MWVHYYSWILVFLSPYMCLLTRRWPTNIHFHENSMCSSNHEIGDLTNIYPHMYVIMVMVFHQYFSYLMVVSFIGGGNPSTQRKPATCRKSLTNFITQCCFEYILSWTGFELTTLLVIGTDCTGRCKFNCHTITTTTATI